uniref:Uncharacterized protein n=1 Tax=Aegilops tauschii subsp. strangulata TaxID=200361 RepID=A0A453L1N2_AEGTS
TNSLPHIPRHPPIHRRLHPIRRRRARRHTPPPCALQPSRLLPLVVVSPLAPKPTLHHSIPSINPSPAPYPFVSPSQTPRRNPNHPNDQPPASAATSASPMAPALSRTLGPSSVAALRPSPSRGLLRAALAPQGRRPAGARGVRWEAGRGRLVGARCASAVAEKTAGEEEEAAGEKFEYQAEVGAGAPILVYLSGWILDPLNLGGVTTSRFWLLRSLVAGFVVHLFTGYNEIESLLPIRL